MANRNVKELKQIARNRKIKYYYRMKKADLIRAIDQATPILDMPIPNNITQNTLAPTQYVPVSYINTIKNKVSSLSNWIMDFVPVHLKKTANDKIKSVKSAVSDLYGLIISKKPIIEFKLTQSAIKNVTKQFSAEGVERADALSYMKSAKNNVLNILNSNKESKIYIVLSCEMERTDLKTGETITTIASFSTKAEVVLESTDLNELYERAEQKILESLSAFQQLGSSWKFVSVKKMDINIIEYKPIKDDHPGRVDKDLKEQSEKLNWEKIKFSVSLQQITQFEKNNQDISVNVYGYENSVYPLRISENKNRQHEIDLLLISNDETNHYCLIKSISRLLSSQISKHNGKKHFCRNCLQSFSTEESLSKHQLYCDTHDSLRIELPKPNTMIKLNHFKKSMRVPFVVYADFEKEDVKKIYNDYLKFPKDMIITCKDKEEFNNAKICHICEKDLNEDKVKDHCHITGKYRGAAHSDYPAWYYTAPGLAWDAALKITKVKLELLSDYDMILMIKEGIRGGISMISNRLGIANNKYMENYTKTNKIYEYKSNINDNKWIDEIIDRGIQGKKNLKWEISKTPPTPGFEWLDEMMSTIKQGIQSGKPCKLENINNKVSESTNNSTRVYGSKRSNHIGEEYNSNKESTYIQYLDANNLYGWAMSKPLPTHGFEWMDEEELKNWKSISCILEVNLEYPEHLHDLHNDYPLAPERLKIDKVEKLIDWNESDRIDKPNFSFQIDWK
ncbi:uncharacterized protein LOC136096861 [Hydra vulgaris]|uniref:uncharacterized protein LOC136096861 n=1 Tax=Hydra vulgaris TaxID=6087 RepID=UPI0032EA23E5